MYDSILVHIDFIERVHIFWNCIRDFIISCDSILMVSVYVGR